MLKTAIIGSALAAAAWAMSLSANAMADPPRQINVPPGELATALESLSRQEVVEFVYQPEQLKSFHTRGVKGSYSPEAAIRLLLKGTPLELHTDPSGAMVIAPPVPHSRVSASTHPAAEQKEEHQSVWDRFRVAELDQGSPANPPALSNQDVSEVIVTARHEKESSLTIPQAITAFSQKTLESLNIQSFADYATKIPNLSFSYGTGQLGYGDSRTVAIRGISGVGTTGVYIDDTPIPESVDPKVVDIQRIEVLKGPQGTLYGEGSLGGNVRLITNPPSFAGEEFHVTAQAGGTKGGGSADYGVNGVGNIVLMDNRIAMRVIGFESHDAGYVTRTFPANGASGASADVTSVGNQGAIESYGGSFSLLFELSDSLEATARILAQHTEDRGLPVSYAPFPRFVPVSYTLDRQANIQEYAHDGWYLPSLEVVYTIPGLTLTSSTSYFSRREEELEDGTEGTTRILSFYGVPTALAANGYAWPVFTRNNQFNEEVRAAVGGDSWISGVVGARYADTSSEFGYPPFLVPGLAATGLYPTELGWSSHYPFASRDKSIFGEAYVRYAGFELTLGLRKYWLSETSGSVADGLLDGGPQTTLGLESSATGTNPKAALSYKLTSEGLVYASASKGFRAGKPNAALPTVCDPGLAQIGVSRDSLLAVQPDTVWNYEVGAKDRIGRLSLTAAAFQMNWNNIQQTITVPICEVALAANAGAARVRGMELEAVGQLTTELDIRMGLGYEDAKITAQGISGQAVGSRIYQVPQFTAVAAATYTRPVAADFEGFLGLDYSYTGNSLSGTTSYLGNAPVRPAYDIINGRIGVRHDKLEVAVYGKNLFNARPNLGDINPLSYPRFDANENIIPRAALLQPLTVGLQMKYEF